MQLPRRLIRGRSCGLPITLLAATSSLPSAYCRPLAIDDVMTMTSIDQVAINPKGRDIAVVVQRPAEDGEAFGRTPYEIDPSRADIWLVARDGSGSRQLTSGHDSAAGYWCAQWSPDGQQLAVLSTQPEGAEPQGGDAVRLYLWSPEQKSFKRLLQQPMMTMTRYGSPLNSLDLRGGADSDRKPHVCRRDQENAPFLWLDDHRLLAVQMPVGQNSALFTQHARALGAASDTAGRLREGQISSVDVSDSDRTRLAKAIGSYQVEIVVIDTRTSERRLLARVPAFPFRGMLSLLVSPDRKSLAVLAPRGVIKPSELGPKPFNNVETHASKILLMVNISGRSALRPIGMPAEGRYPLDLLDWAEDSSALLFRARQTGDQRVARVFSFRPASGAVETVAPGIVQDPGDAAPEPHELSVRWSQDGALLVRGREASSDRAPEIWWQINKDGRLPARVDPPASKDLKIPADGEFLASDQNGLLWQEPTKDGLALKEAPASGEHARNLLLIDRHLSDIDWGSVSTLDYTSESGEALKALLILPPGHQPGERHPTLVWVYPGTKITGGNDYWADKRLPGIYNLQLYAAKGYAVLIPSMPLSRASASGPYIQMRNGVIPAVDRLLQLGFAEPNRIGLFGQSFGGYATYALVTQTDRFAAAAAIAGMTNLVADYGSFDRGATGWSGLAQDKSVNPIISSSVMGMNIPPYADPEVYANNSPVNHTAAIHTPLLMAHGSLDVRGSIEEAETVFTLLDKQGKRARLLRYEGENHAIALSPANVRNLFEELCAWFDRYLKNGK
ncbi:prolyl oligopeptidase family protein [Novosphingobium sp. PhB55]|nr:prolyl oligopeptidase family protein [Novosphingobium sp. PhB55]